MAADAADNTREPDPHGQAALLLVESLIHGLIARAMIDVQDAIDIVDTAAEVKQDVADAWGDSATTMRKSLALLARIGMSLKQDIPTG